MITSDPRPLKRSPRNNRGVSPQPDREGHPDAAAKILIDANPGVFENTGLVYQSQEKLSASYLKDANGKVGTQTADTWQQLADFLYRAGLLADEDGKPLTAPLDTSTLFTEQYLSGK